jgi:hypothetical protein
MADLKKSAILFTLTNITFIFLQASTAFGYIDFSGLLGQLFVQSSPYGEYGYISGRFSGAVSTPSGLGAASAVGFSIFFSDLMKNRNSTGNNPYSIALLLLSLLLLISSGHRTSIVAVAVLFVIYIPVYVIKSGYQISKNYTSYLIALASICIIYYFDIGRIKSERYMTFVNPDLLWRELGVRIDRWEMVVHKASEFSDSPVYINPQQALNIPTIDSGYILLYVQGGPILVLLFALILVSTTMIFIQLQHRDMSLSIAGGSFVSIIAVISLMQNTITSMWGRVLIGLFIGIMAHLLVNQEDHQQDHTLVKLE